MVREFLSAGLEAVFKELHVSTTAVAALLVLDFILDHKGLRLEVDGLGKGRGDGVVGCLALRDETLVTFDDGNGGVFDLPFADVAEGFTADGCLLGRLGGCPPICPVVCELLDEGSFDGGALGGELNEQSNLLRVHVDDQRTLNTGLASSARTNAPDAAAIARTE